MHKLSHQVEGKWVPHSYPQHFSLVSKDNASPKIVAGVPGGDSTVFLRLVECLEPPYLLLYVLHTPRGEADAGRYQSPPVSAEQLREFVEKFGSCLAADARFDIWAHSSAEQATVVWDRHNQLFAYGPIEKFSSVLRADGFFDGVVDVSFPHQHHYRQEFDEQAAAVLDAFEWTNSPLRREDGQWVWGLIGRPKRMPAAPLGVDVMPDEWSRRPLWMHHQINSFISTEVVTTKFIASSAGITCTSN